MPHVSRSEVFIVDDEPTSCELLSAIFTVEGYRVTSFEEGNSFLAVAHKRAPALILLDVNLPGRSGLDVLKELDAPNYPAPVFMISGQTDIPTVVSAIKQGALDFIEKPFEADAVVAQVRKIMAYRQRPSAESQGNGSHRLSASNRLTPREHEVLTRITDGASNKEAGRQLGISPRTIEVHRARIMEKMGAKNAADLVRIVLLEDGALRQT
jgi:two-component system response regulator FixJ